MQNDSIDNVRLDINNEKVRACVYTRLGDTKTRTLHISLADRGTVVDLSNAVFVEVLIHKPDGNETDQGAVVVGNEIHYTLRTQDVNVEGESLCQIMITFSDESVLTSPTFSIMVFKKEIDDRAVQSMNEYTAIQQQAAASLNSANNAARSEQNTSMIEANVMQIQTDVIEREENIRTIHSNVLELHEDIENIQTDIIEHQENIEDIQIDVTAKATTAEECAKSSMDSETNCKISEINAKTSEESALAAETYIKEREDFTELNAKKSQSYAVGGTDYREEEDIDNSAYYYEQTKTIAQSFSGAMLFIGTTTFEALPFLSEVEAGWQYNISNEFTTDERFIEGAGIIKSAGNDIVCVIRNGNKYWNCLSGVTVHGVKGEAEETYRQGNVNITPSNIGLGNVDNTSDEDKPISKAMRTELDTKAKSEVLNLHTLNGNIHVTSEDQAKWNAYENTISELNTEIATLKAMLGYPLAERRES